jgi:alcohol oxidase
MSTPTKINEEYDIIVAGGAPSSSGSSPLPGSLLTDRTSYRWGCWLHPRRPSCRGDLDSRILVLEAGPPTYNNPVHRQPARFLSHLMPGSRTVRVHTSRPSAALGDRIISVADLPPLRFIIYSYGVHTCERFRLR